MHANLSFLVACACLTTGGVALPVAAADPERVPLRVAAAGHNAVASEPEPGVCEVRTTGDDPYIACERVNTPFDHARVFVLAFDYQCPDGLDSLEVFFGSPFSPDARVAAPALAPATAWTPFAVRLPADRPEVWTEAVRDFRLDFGSVGGRVIRLRGLCLRPPTVDEERADQERAAAVRRQLADLQARVRTSCIHPARLTDTTDALAAVLRYPDAAGQTVVAVLGRDLDLVTQVTGGAATVRPAAPLPPPMVVGEGPDPEQHTLVRILDRYGLCELQFLAYPPGVRGGVQVASGRTASGQPMIVTAPLSDAAVRELRLFSRHGHRLGTIAVADALAPPFVIAVGDFVSTVPGDEIAVATAAGTGDPRPLLVYAADGRLLATLGVPAAGAAPGAALFLSAERAAAAGQPDGVVAHVAGRPEFHRVEANGRVDTRAAGLGPDAAGVYPSACPDRPYAATVAEESLSHLDRLGSVAGAAAERLDVGTKENRFWFTTGGAFRDLPAGRYVRPSEFAHLRTDFASPVAADPDFARTDPEYWAGAAYRRWVGGRLQDFDTALPRCWEPCFTHRWFASQARTWAAARDPETGLPAYTLVTRDNATGTYGEFGQNDAFVSGSYAPDLTPVECFYQYPLRAFLGELVPHLRANPEHAVAVEPNHEMEINAESETTHGDYNPSMIRAFCRYLLSLYADLDGINRVFGTPFTPDWFDAPRDLQRGPWDAYATANPYYLVWMRFQNYVVYRVVAGTYREALLAGLPPEAVKCHQIPDHYAIASLTAFSKPARRITPIDWNLNAGVGYGCTRYGVWFDQRHNCVQGPNSSGFDAMVIGEYQSLTADADLAYRQLVYMQEHGVQFIHAMTWPQGHDRGYNAALRTALARLIQEDRPRLGQTGGTGQVRACRQGDRAFDVVSLGTRPQTTGLLKSVRADGSWEGSVYVVPFHARVAVEPLHQAEALDLVGDPLSCGPFPGIDAGNQLEFSFLARSANPGAAPAAVSLRVYHHGIELSALRVTIPAGPEWQHARFLLRVQIDTDDLRVELGSGAAGTPSWLTGRVALRDLVVTRQSEQTTKLKKGVFEGRRHAGGVTFDLLPDDQG